MGKQQRVGSQSGSKRDQPQKAARGTSRNGHEDEVAKFEQELAGYLQERIKPGLNRGAIPLLARSIARDIAHRELPEDSEMDDEQSAEADDDFSDEADDEQSAEADDDFDDEAEDEPSAEADDDLDDEADEEPSADADDDLDDEADEEPSAEADDEADEEPSADADDDVDDEADEEPSAEADDDVEDEADDEPSADGDAQADFEAEMRDLQEELGEDWTLRFSVQGDDAWLTAEKDDGSQHVEAPTASVLVEAVELLNESGGRSS